MKERRERGGEGGEEKERERECDFLSGPTNHLYSLGTPINYLVHIPFTILLLLNTYDA